MPDATRLRLMSRPGCHLCETMAADLQALGLAFDLVNIEEDAALEATYGNLIPVLLLGDTEIARAPQSARTLQRSLQRSGVI